MGRSNHSSGGAAAEAARAPASRSGDPAIAEFLKNSLRLQGRPFVSIMMPPVLSASRASGSIR
jgi:hypothetical protein